MCRTEQKIETNKSNWLWSLASHRTEKKTIHHKKNPSNCQLVGRMRENKALVSLHFFPIPPPKFFSHVVLGTNNPHFKTIALNSKKVNRNNKKSREEFIGKERYTRYPYPRERERERNDVCLRWSTKKNEMRKIFLCIAMRFDSGQGNTWGWPHFFTEALSTIQPFFYAFLHSGVVDNSAKHCANADALSNRERASQHKWRSCRFNNLRPSEE